MTTKTPAMQQYHELSRTISRLEKERYELAGQIDKEAGRFTHPHKSTRTRIGNRIEKMLSDLRYDAFCEAYGRGMYATPPDPSPAPAYTTASTMT